MLLMLKVKFKIHWGEKRSKKGVFTYPKVKNDSYSQ